MIGILVFDGCKDTGLCVRPSINIQCVNSSSSLDSPEMKMRLPHLFRRTSRRMSKEKDAMTALVIILSWQPCPKCITASLRSIVIVLVSTLSFRVDLHFW